MSRIANASRNITYGYLGLVLTTLLKFAARTIFIYTIGITYLGVNGLYTNVLSVLSFAELGIGTAMNYSLYKPVARQDRETIKALMQLYRRAYRWIALVVAVIGLVLLPFLPLLIRDPGAIGSSELRLYYLIFLFNTVSSYLVSYKFSLVNAEQKNYIQTNIRTLTTVVITLVQVLVLLFWRSFLIYLLSAAALELLHKIYVNAYLNRRYPELRERNVQPLPAGEKATIKKNIRALVYHKVGDISVHQTDNILISAFVNITTVGLVANYTLIMTSVTGFINIAFNAVVSGFGNLIATEPVEKQYLLFKVYRFAGFWLYGFATIAFAVLLGPFIRLWIGPDMLIASTVIYLILFDYYLKGHRIVLHHFKSAAGVFDADKHIAIIQAVVNLVVSIVLVRLIGLPGIYVGTVVQGLVSTILRPFIVYRQVFRRSGLVYFYDGLIYLAALALPLLLLLLVRHVFLPQPGVAGFLLLALLVLLLPNGLFILFFRRREEFIYLWRLVRQRLKRRAR